LKFDKDAWQNILATVKNEEDVCLRDKVPFLRDIMNIIVRKTVSRKDFVFVTEGDWGGQLYFTCPADQITASAQEMEDLVVSLDQERWSCNEGEGYGHYLLPKILVKFRGGISAGMGGTNGFTKAHKEFWIHPTLAHHAESVKHALGITSKTPAHSCLGSIEMRGLESHCIVCDRTFRW